MVGGGGSSKKCRIFLLAGMVRPPDRAVSAIQSTRNFFEFESLVFFEVFGDGFKAAELSSKHAAGNGGFNLLELLENVFVAEVVFFA